MGDLADRLDERGGARAKCVGEDFAGSEWLFGASLVAGNRNEG
jgi:hypothetical protein